jgi:hypothetical protein
MLATKEAEIRSQPHKQFVRPYIKKKKKNHHKNKAGEGQADQAERALA